MNQLPNFQRKNTKNNLSEVKVSNNLVIALIPPKISENLVCILLK